MNVTARSLVAGAFPKEALGGLLLLISAGAALLLANSPWAAAIAHLWEIPLSLGWGGQAFTLSLHHWINDGLMAVFFLVVGLEIKRELISGELASLRQAALPISGAIGGMVLPALFYLLFNHEGPAARGWGIPMATDIAFALGALALVAPRIPKGAKVFLAALAIVDDMGAVLVIAFFYTNGLEWHSIAGAGLTLLVLIVFNFAGIRSLWPYLLAGVALWYFVYQSGIHATIAGVALAFTIPARPPLSRAKVTNKTRALLKKLEGNEKQPAHSGLPQDKLAALEQLSVDATAPLIRLEHGLQKVTAYVIMPLFAFANSGLSFGQRIGEASVVIGILAGLVLGKPLGITFAVYLAVKLRLASLPRGVSWLALHGCTWLAGIGFTMSLFITMLAFQDEALVESAKLAILIACAVTALVGALLLQWERRAR